MLPGVRKDAQKLLAVVHENYKVIYMSNTERTKERDSRGRIPRRPLEDPLEDHQGGNRRLEPTDSRTN